MTGHGHATVVSELLEAYVEIRTINNRFFKCSLSHDLPADIQAKVEECVRERVARGSVTVRLRLQHASNQASFRLNETAIRAYQNELSRLGLPPASTDSLLSLPGAVVEQENFQDIDTLWPIIEQAVSEALDQLDSMRRQEGALMAANLLANLDQLQNCLRDVERINPEIVVHFEQRLTDRINALAEKHNLNAPLIDVIREVGIFAERVDVAEEVVRLRSHCELFRSTMQAKQSNGRKLDFVVQEMLRETNTIGSKCGAAEVANLVVEMKTVIERMREMVQNIE